MNEPIDLGERSALVEVGRYPRLSDANERALVVLAMGCGYWMFREREEYVLCVEEKNHAAVIQEIGEFDEESRSWPRHILREAGRVGADVSLYVFVLLMSCFFLAQQDQPERWLQRGAASSSAIIQHGEWWRTITALTLHADLAHLLANLATGVLFAAALIPLLGTGVTWVAVAAAGALGNMANAWFYRTESHESIGASTAVFGALGVLVAYQVAARVNSRRRFSRTEILLPLGAGLALLAYLGTSGERTDFMAHFWGFGAGILIGAIAGLPRCKERTPPSIQRLLAISVPCIFILAWRLAMH